MQNGRVEIVDADGLIHDTEAEIVGLADDLAARNSRAGHPYAEGIRIVIAAHIARGDWHTAEFGVPDDERIVEPSAAFQIFEQTDSTDESSQQAVGSTENPWRAPQVGNRSGAIDCR